MILTEFHIWCSPYYGLIFVIFSLQTTCFYLRSFTRTKHFTRTIYDCSLFILRLGESGTLKMHLLILAVSPHLLILSQLAYYAHIYSTLEVAFCDPILCSSNTLWNT